MLTNSNSGATVAQELLRSIARVCGWPDFRPVPRVLAAVPLCTQAGYRGHYRADGFVDFAVQLVGQQLQLVVPDQLACIKQPTGSIPAATGIPFHRLTPHQR
ncbi:MAG: hypothetical protein ACRYG7_15575 [Janthinobacterium lividum]